MLAHNSDTVSLDAFTRAQSTKDTLDRMEKQIKNIASTLKQGGELSESLGKEAQVIIKRIQKEGGEQRQAFATVLNAIKIENGLSMEDREKLKHEDRETEIEKIKEQGEQNRAFEKLKGENSQKILEILNPTTIGVATIAVLLSFYSLKYGFPALIDYWKCPHVISETSRCGFFDWSKRPEIIDINDLIFKPSLQKQLLDLLVRIQTATKYKEALPNVFFYGVPGTGKTSFVKVLAYASGLDYALTSGSEFAKITDLNRANNELRSLLNWAKTSKKGLIVFIDEAESLFANRRLPTISKQTQDFINTFLALISEQSQKKVMFVLATNHPFKMDESVVNRMGISIEFTLPEVIEREKILSMYVSKFAQENKNALIELSSEFLNLIPTYAESLKGFSPRGIKFIAEEMSVSARRQTPMRLTKEIAQEVISKAKSSLQKIEGWDKARNEWLGA
ncbi:MAG: AAA family ATPase [Parachlamydiales bacterium]|nr:AAA family ATPase [Parachlamydiales bacterium]